MSVILRTIKALIFQLCIIANSIYYHLYVASFPMFRHAPRHCLKQLMKLHRNLETLTKCGTIYGFLVKEHNFESISDTL